MSTTNQPNPIINPIIDLGSNRSLLRKLFEEGYRFDFFQAVRLLELAFPKRTPVGRDASADHEVVRFAVRTSLSFPASSVYELELPKTEAPPRMVVNFMGLTGPSGALPRHYTELLMQVQRDLRHKEKYALRDWFDLYNHRIIALFHRIWEKYRFYIPFGRGEYDADELDNFSLAIMSLVGLGLPSLRHRLKVQLGSPKTRVQLVGRKGATGEGQTGVRPVAKLEDLTLAYFGGFFSQARPTATNLEMMLRDYLGLPVTVQQFLGQWILLEKYNQSRLVSTGRMNNELGSRLVLGERVWDVQGKIRVRVGPLRYQQFLDLLPDKAPSRERKAFFLLVHLIRLYIGVELDFDVQLVLLAEEIRPCQFATSGIGARLGWNTWLSSQRAHRDADDVVFEGEEVYWVNLSRDHLL